MATKIKVKVGTNNVAEYEVDSDVKAVSQLVNDALKNEEKFVTFTLESGKDRSVMADRVIAIWEE
jgi:hypothetical protein